MTTNPACNRRHGGDFNDYRFDDDQQKAYCQHCGLHLLGAWAMFSPAGRAYCEQIDRRMASRTWRQRHSREHRGTPYHRVPGRPWSHIAVIRDYVDFNTRRNDRRFRTITQVVRQKRS